MWWMAAACTMSSPVEGPGFDPDGTLVSAHEGPFVVAVTHARSAAGQQDAFAAHVDAITAAIALAPGFVGSSLRGHRPGRDNWTLSIWESEEAMDEFVLTGPHLAAMSEAGLVLEEAGFAHFEAEASELPPTWEDALQALE